MAGKMKMEHEIFHVLEMSLFSGMLAIPVILLGFWFWMVIDCVQNEPAEGNEKLVWVIILMFTSFLGAAMYFFIRRRERVKRERIKMPRSGNSPGSG